MKHVVTYFFPVTSSVFRPRHFLNTLSVNILSAKEFIQPKAGRLPLFVCQATAYSAYSQLPSIYLGLVLHLQTEDARRHVNKTSPNMVYFHY